MRVFIAEKPSLARAIAEGLGGGTNGEGCITCGNDVVTWCFGHLFELATPDAYDPAFKQWSRETLPIIPDKWQLVARKGVGKQISVIRKQVKQCSLVVNAGDPDREGQLLVDEVLDEIGYTGPAQRLWLASLDPKSVAKALASLRDNKDYQALSQAALARSRADWLVGINATRALTLLGRDKGMQGVLSLGRVQTPTLAMVVNRDRERANFKPNDYLVLNADLGVFQTTLELPEGSEGMDSENRLVDKQVAAKIKAAAEGQTGTIADVKAEKKAQKAPLPHSLSSLQKEASAKFSMSAKQVLDVAQSLYEKRLTTYPRSDCQYLPEEQFGDAAGILSALAGMFPIAAKADASIRSGAWNTAKVTAHHGIIPTGMTPNGLSKEEEQIYGLICMNYAAQFHKPYTYEAQRITVDLGGQRWVCTGRKTIEAGWSEFFSKKEERELPPVTAGDSVSCSAVKIEAKKTTPPAAFTEGTLIAAMASVHRFVTDAEAKKRLKENEGLGTEATRAGIIETLKQRGYLKAEKKALVSTDLGRSVIDLTPELLKDPVTTAQWETRLNAIADGKERFDDFMQAQTVLVPDLITPILTAKGEGFSAHVRKCPDCGNPMRRLPSKKEKGKYFWACFNEAHEKPVFEPDGKPNAAKKANASAKPDPKAKCPTCGEPMRRLKSQKKANTYFWACSDRSHPLCSDDKGKLGKPFGGK